MDKLETMLPNFLVVGAARSGTTSLFYYLLQHPEIYMPKRKECMFFSGIGEDIKGRGELFKKGLIRDINDYRNLFAGKKDEKAIGEVSPDYLYFYEKSIKNIIPILGSKVKIIILLRNPVDRAYSHYLHHVRYGIEELSFENALSAEPIRMQQHYYWAFFYATAGFYSSAVRAYYDNFSHVRVYLYDDFKENPLQFMKDVYAFLGVDPLFTPNVSNKYNVSGEYKNPIMRILSQRSDLLKKLFYPIFKKWSENETGRKKLEKILSKFLVKPQLTTKTSAYLKSLYREDILKTQELIKRDLSSWLQE